MNTFERYLAAEYDLNQGLIRLERSMAGEDVLPFDQNKKMETMREFLNVVGNPQKGIPAVHVAGTSGKGSVAAAAAGILSKAGFRTGLHVSPYLQAVTEKTWINGQYVSADEFVDVVNDIMPIAKRFLNSNTPASIHGMASVAITLELFRRNKVEVMVFEAGCGGRFDLSSFVDTVVSVVTNVGMDHLKTLGPSIEQIAWHKAGIARHKVPLFTGASGVALDVIKKEAEKIGAPLSIVERTNDVFSHNKQLAIRAALKTINILGCELDYETAEESAFSVVLPGRSERMPCNTADESSPLIILDGAHNQDKLDAAVYALMNCKQMRANTPRICVFGALGAKAGLNLAKPLINQFDLIIVTEPQVFGKPPSPASNTALLFKKAGCPVEIIPNPQDALTRAIACADSHGTVFATGSFYLIGDLRERFYPTEQIVLQRTSFPKQLRN